MKRILVFVMLLTPGLCWPEDVTRYTARLAIGDWEPDIHDIGSALDLMKHDVWPSYNKFHPFRAYRFQYYGIIKNDKKVVAINGFCASYWQHAKDWRTTMVVVMDGGACFFQAEYSVMDGKIISVRFNGEA